MSTSLFYLLVGSALWCLGLHGLLVTRHALRRIIAINIMGSGVFLVMVALATRVAPVDAILQALVVTGLVVAVSATAFALRLAGAESDHEAAQVPPKSSTKVDAP